MMARRPVPQAEAAPAAQRFKEIGDLNDFEKKLLEEVGRHVPHVSGCTVSVWFGGAWRERLDTEPCLAMLQVIPPGEVGTCFDDIGALDNVKSALREVPTSMP